MNSLKKDIDICCTFLKKCERQNLEAVKSYYGKHSATINKHKGSVFQYLCKKNYLEITQWYFSLLLSMHQDFDYETRLLDELGLISAFKLACKEGHLDMAQWLNSLSFFGIPPTIKDDLFRKACENNHLNIVEWFVLLRPDRYSFTVEEKEIITIIPHINTDIGQEMYECDILPCSICDDESQIITIFCNHQFCRNCMDSWTKIHESCPLCREFIAHRGYFTIVPKKF
jgi:hypothetical protein